MKEKNVKNQEGTAVAKPKKKKKKVLIIVLVIAAILVVVIGTAVHNMTKAVSTAANTIEVQPVELRDLSDTISLKGTVAGVSSTNVTSKAVSEITSVNVQAGDLVKEGDVLCTLDSASIQEKITDLEKSLNNASAVNDINSRQTADAVAQAKEDQQRQLDAAEKQITEAEGSYNWTRGQYDQGLVDFPTLHAAQKAFESARDNYDSILEATSRAVENAEIAVQLDQYKDSDSAAKDTLASLKEQLADCEVKAPCGGVVTAVNVRVGDINAEKVTILTIEDTSALKMVASVQEADILKLQEGMKAVINADALGEQELSGTVTRVVRVKSSGSAAEGGMPGAGGYSVELSLDTTELLVGMEVKAKVMLKEKSGVLAVPYDLTRYDEAGQAYVLVGEKEKDGSLTVVRKDITLGEEVDYYTEVIGGDLKEGELLIFDYINSVAEGQTIRPEQLTYSTDGSAAGDSSADGAAAAAAPAN